jgi:hypothetical protein
MEAWMPDRRSRSSKALKGAILAAAVAAFAPSAAVGAELETILAAGGAGHAPSGITRDNDGNVWVADHLKGVCKVEPTSANSPGRLIEDEDPFLCGVVFNPPPYAPVGPVSIAFDPSISSFYVSAGGGIWRLHLDQATGTIDAGGADAENPPSGQIVALATPAGEIAEGMAFKPATATTDAYIDFTSKRAPFVQRITRPEDCGIVVAGTNECSTTPRLTNVGTVNILSGARIAHLGDAIYLAEELAGLTRIQDPGPGAPTAQPVQGLPAHVATSVAGDSTYNRVYVGATVAGGDRVLAYTPASGGDWSTYVADLGGVLALHADPNNGDLLIDDDPSAAAGGPEAANGSIYRMPLTSMLIPQTTFSQRPGSFLSATAFTFGYQASTSNATFECRLDSSSGPWTPCGAGSEAFQNVSELADGRHVFEVRAIDSNWDDVLNAPIGAGHPAVSAFRVDTVAPTTIIENAPADHTPSENDLRLYFHSNEGSNATFDCRLDNIDWASCDSGERFAKLKDGNHLIEVRATDRAGNVGPTALWEFRIGLETLVTTSSVSAIPPAPLAPRTPSPYGPVNAKARIVGRSMIVTVPSVPGATSARIIIERKGKKKANGLPSPPQILVSRIMTLTPGADTTFTWKPSAKLLGKLVNVRSIRVLVRVGPRSWDLGSARAAKLTSPSSIWALRR